MKTGVLLVNVGTPDSFDVKDVRKYLSEFLNDPRVIDLPWLYRKLLVNLIIVPFRSPKTASLYKKIWTEEGSPLLKYGKILKEQLQKELGNNYFVEMAMRYRKPGLEESLENFKKLHLDKLIILPLFPQYASASTGTVLEKVMQVISAWQVIPSLKLINSYCNDNLFINSWIEVSRPYMTKPYDAYVFSFHGLPERQIKKSDQNSYCLMGNCCDTYNNINKHCYRAQCFETARAIAEGLNIPRDKYYTSFQSRLGNDPWIQPFTDNILKDLAASGKKKVLVFAPSFISDCLETIFEIAVEYAELFEKNGGKKLQLVESLNEHPSWIKALKNLVLNN